MCETLNIFSFASHIWSLLHILSLIFLFLNNHLKVKNFFLFDSKRIWSTGLSLPPPWDLEAMVKILVLLWVRGEAPQDSEQRSDTTSHVFKRSLQLLLGRTNRRGRGVGSEGRSRDISV